MGLARGGDIIDIVDKLVYVSHVHRALDLLDERERRVITLRFGIADGRCRSLQEVAEEFGVMKEKIRQTENLALWKLGECKFLKSGPVSGGVVNG